MVNDLLKSLDLNANKLNIIENFMKGHAKGKV